MGFRIWEKTVNTNDFDFEFDESLIAQHPEEVRENCRLLTMDKRSGALSHRHFYDIKDLLNPGDLLVINDTKVLPARLFGSRPGKEESIEVLLLKNLHGKVWECMVRPGKKMKIGTEVVFSDELSAKVIDITEDGLRHVELKYEGVLEEILDRLGTMPLPPYIKEELEDQSLYQTVYAKHTGSAAAPTAGLHFSKKLLAELEEKGVEIAKITLHVGLGTFRPVKVKEIEDHKMHSEYYIVTEENAKKIRDAKARGSRVVSVGTTTTRTLESVWKKYGEVRAASGWTDIFIYPGFEFGVVDALITNFHLPKSTLIMLVSAFSSREKILEAYRVAVKERYRFFSFGDAMFIY